MGLALGLERKENGKTGQIKKPGNGTGRNGHFVKQAGLEIPVVPDDVKLKNALDKMKPQPEARYNLEEIGRFGC
ncbi:MAG: hypothetical protein PHS02_00740 [Candidatus ainarchaeum sp.]|nr:hypothetical protein [Candidatus ainarchaeum sp.]